MSCISRLQKARHVQHIVARAVVNAKGADHLQSQHFEQKRASRPTRGARGRGVSKISPGFPRLPFHGRAMEARQRDYRDSLHGSGESGSRWQAGKRRREAEEDDRLLTLHLLLQALTGTIVTVECKDGTIATGTIKSTDDSMKCASTL